MARQEPECSLGVCTLHAACLLHEVCMQSHLLDCCCVTDVRIQQSKNVIHASSPRLCGITTDSRLDASA